MVTIGLAWRVPLDGLAHRAERRAEGVRRRPAPAARERPTRLVAVAETQSADGSFGTFYESSYEGLVRLAVLLVGAVPVAEDLVQDAFVNVHRRWGAVNDPLPYARRAVVNACRSHHRRRFLERRHDRPVEEPTTHLVADELGDALAALPDRQRAAVVLRFYADLSEAETAAVLGCRPGTVGSLIHRAMAALRAALGDDEASG